jgi:hypothetical protein
MTAGAVAAGLFAGPSASSPGTCVRFYCSITLAASGPSPSTLTVPATSQLFFENTDSVAHTVVFANGLCSFTVAPQQDSECATNPTFYVGSYPYTVDGKFAGTVVTRPLRRSVTLTARGHGIRRGTSLTLHGRVSWINYHPWFSQPQFHVIVLRRQNGSQAFKQITTGRLWSSQPNANRSGTVSFSWKRKVHPGDTTTYIAKVVGYEGVWSAATSRAFTVRIRKDSR